MSETSKHTPRWEQISGKYISIDHGETPQVFRAATEAEMTLMLAAPDLLAACKLILADGYGTALGDLEQVRAAVAKATSR